MTWYVVPRDLPRDDACVPIHVNPLEDGQVGDLLPQRIQVGDLVQLVQRRGDWFYIRWTIQYLRKHISTTLEGWVRATRVDGIQVLRPWHETDIFACYSVQCSPEMDTEIIMFEGPFETSPMYGALKKNVHLSVISRQGEWMEFLVPPSFEIENKETLWFRMDTPSEKSLLRFAYHPSHPACSESHAFFRIRDSGSDDCEVSVYDFPTLDSQRLGTLDKGDIIEASLVSGDWIRVSYLESPCAWILWRDSLFGTEYLESFTPKQGSCHETNQQVELVQAQNSTEHMDHMSMSSLQASIHDWKEVEEDDVLAKTFHFCDKHNSNDFWLLHPSENCSLVETSQSSIELRKATALVSQLVNRALMRVVEWKAFLEHTFLLATDLTLLHENNESECIVQTVDRGVDGVIFKWSNTWCFIRDKMIEEVEAFIVEQKRQIADQEQEKATRKAKGEKATEKTLSNLRPKGFGISKLRPPGLLGQTDDTDLSALALRKYHTISGRQRLDPSQFKHPTHPLGLPSTKEVIITDTTRIATMNSQATPRLLSGIKRPSLLPRFSK